MPCFHPLSAFQRVTPGPNGKRSVIFNPAEALRYATTPLTLPCGRCTGCLLDRAKAWALRCSHEALKWDRSCFLTLTYRPADLPEHGSLDHRDFQLFMKRLRKWHEPNLLSFYMCGEYGTQGDRPHYHAIIFGLDFHQDRVVQSRKRGTTLYRSPTLDHLWGKGFASIGSVTFQSASYVARYCLKKTKVPNGDYDMRYKRVNVETGEIHEVRPEYNRMSLNPAIGRDFFDSYSADIYPHDFCIIEGKKVRTPRYYDRLLEAKNPEILDRVKTARKSRAKLQAANSTPERLAVREEVLAAKLNKLKRDIE